MSDVMLHGVLCMPPELWNDSELDKMQRHSRYLQASRRIKDDGMELERMREALAELARYFTSGNSVPVERATILAKDFWRITGLTPNA